MLLGAGWPVSEAPRCLASLAPLYLSARRISSPSETFAEELIHRRAVDHHPVHVDVDLVPAPVGDDRPALVAHDQRLRTMLAHRVSAASRDGAPRCLAALVTAMGSAGISGVINGFTALLVQLKNRLGRPDRVVDEVEDLGDLEQAARVHVSQLVEQLHRSGGCRP